VVTDECAGSASLWVSDGTPAGTARVPLSGELPGTCRTGGLWSASGDGKVFLQDAGIWASDGTAEGTHRVRDESWPGRSPFTDYDEDLKFSRLGSDMLFVPGRGGEDVRDPSR
jgi:hypothetical protein